LAFNPPAGLRLAARLWGPRCHFHARERTHTGLVTDALLSVGSRAPVFWSTFNTFTSPPFWLAARQDLPVWAGAELRGLLIPLPWWPAAVSLPVFWSMVKMAMLLWPRLEQYRNLPEGWTTTSAVELPFVGFGSVEIVWMASSLPEVLSNVIAVTLEVISLQ